MGRTGAHSKVQVVKNTRVCCAWIYETVSEMISPRRVLTCAGRVYVFLCVCVCVCVCVHIFHAYSLQQPSSLLHKLLLSW